MRLAFRGLFTERHLRPLPHPQIGREVLEVASFVRVAAELLHEEGDTRVLALSFEVSRPFDVHWAASGATLAANDEPGYWLLAIRHRAGVVVAFRGCVFKMCATTIVYVDVFALVARRRHEVWLKIHVHQ